MRHLLHSLQTDKRQQQRVSLAIVLAFCFISLFLNLFQKQSTQACMNADEAAHGYNAFSILSTGRDEYDTSFPLRFKSFGEYKMPLYTYSIVPFVAIFGLTIEAVRSPNSVMSFLYPLAVYFLAVNVFHKRRIGLLAAAITMASLGLHNIGRQGHEAYMSTLFMIVATAAFIRTVNKKSWTWTLLCAGTLAAAMLGYQAARIYALLLVIVVWAYTIRRAFPRRQALVLTAVVVASFIPDLLLPPQRVGSLWYFASEGLHLKVLEYRMEGGSSIIFNKLTIALYDLLMRHVAYFTPQFLIERGDPNFRFGYPDMSPVNPLVYAFFLVGLYGMSRRMNRDYMLFFIFLIVAPVAGSLTWADISLTRALYLLPLIHVAAAYGVYIFFIHLNKRKRHLVIGVTSIILLYGYFALKTWQIFLYHYPNRDEVARAQQCGYDDLGAYIRSHPDVSRYYITRENGQPYIYILFHTRYDPRRYQMSNHLSSPDEYGFGQVNQFDNYEFSFPRIFEPGSVVVGIPDDVRNQEGMRGVDEKYLTWIEKGKYRAFFIYPVANK